MKSFKSLFWPCFALAIGSLVPAVALAAPTVDNYSLNTSAFYTSGNYGRAQSTDIFYLPVTAGFATGRWALDLTLPYIQVTGAGNVIPNIGAVNAPSSTRRTRSGMGDVRMSATYRAYQDNKEGLAVDLGMKVKLGTASYANGLGTGKNDYALQVGVSKSLGHLLLSGTVGYQVHGSPARIHLRNVAYGEADAIYRFSRRNSLGFSVLSSGALTATSSNPLLTAAYYKHVFDRDWSAMFYALKGFSNGSPDYGAGASIKYSFAG